MAVLGDFTATTLSGDDRSFSAYGDDVVLVVSTASRCGLTPQLAALETFYEPGTEEEIGEFCQ